MATRAGSRRGFGAAEATSLPGGKRVRRGCSERGLDTANSLRGVKRAIRVASARGLDGAVFVTTRTGSVRDVRAATSLGRGKGTIRT